MNNRTLFLQHVAQTSDFPLALEIVKAEGAYMWDKSGKKYLDLISGIAVSNVGHRHPRVVEAIKEQVDKYMHLMVYGEFIQSPQVLLAKALAGQLPSHLQSVYFVNSGSEAIEGAMKLAKRFTGRSEVISCYNAYHGSTQGSLSIMGSETFKQAYRPLLPDCRQIQYNSFENLNQITERTACVIIETVQGEAGVILPQNNFLNALRIRSNDVGALLVLDEIQCGFGRTGKLFAFEHYGITPDILCLAKGMGGGMPIGAFISSKEIMQSLTHHPMLGHITTFGGHPVCAAAAMATLQIIIDEKLETQAAAKEILFREKLKHPKIKEIRGKGLLLALQFESFEQNKIIIDKCIDKGLITDWFLFNSSAMRIAPPLNISNEQIEWACEILLQCMSTN
jgi:acetylornithine/succinyldiaminopimelate/putrescine aminotransferase